MSTTDLFQIRCSNCGSRLNAKTSLIGQTRNCPKCQTPILIQREDSAEAIKSAESASSTAEGTTPIILNVPSITEFAVVPTLDDGVTIENLPDRLAFRNRYLVLSSDRIIAVWETGKGWQVNIGNGYAPVKKNITAIPDQGVFALVEVVIGSENDESLMGGAPTALNVFKVSLRGALTSLYRDENEILRKVDCNGELTKNQKNLLLNFLRQNFMGDTLFGAQSVVDYLSE